MGDVTPLIHDAWDDTEDAVEPLVLVPEGEYPVVYLHHEYLRIFGTHKARAVFEVTEGGFEGARLERFFNVRYANKRYRAPLSPRCNYRRDMCACTGKPTDNLSSLRNLELLASVSTVVRDHNGNDLALEGQYSRIVRLRKA